MQENTERLSRVLKAIASHERRTILSHFVSNKTDVVTIEVLSSKLARLQVEAGDVNEPSTETAVAKLHHVHLPKLEDCGLVEYDARSGTVRYDPDEQVERLVEDLTEL